MGNIDWKLGYVSGKNMVICPSKQSEECWKIASTFDPSKKTSKTSTFMKISEKSAAIFQLTESFFKGAWNSAKMINYKINYIFNPSYYSELTFDDNTLSRIANTGIEFVAAALDCATLHTASDLGIETKYNSPRPTDLTSMAEYFGSMVFFMKTIPTIKKIATPAKATNLRTTGLASKKMPKIETQHIKQPLKPVYAGKTLMIIEPILNLFRKVTQKIKKLVNRAKSKAEKTVSNQRKQYLGIRNKIGRYIEEIAQANTKNLNRLKGLLKKHTNKITLIILERIFDLFEKKSNGSIDLIKIIAEKNPRLITAAYLKKIFTKAKDWPAARKLFIELTEKGIAKPIQLKAWLMSEIGKSHSGWIEFLSDVILDHPEWFDGKNIMDLLRIYKDLHSAKNKGAFDLLKPSEDINQIATRLGQQDNIYSKTISVYRQALEYLSATNKDSFTPESILFILDNLSIFETRILKSLATTNKQAFTKPVVERLIPLGKLINSSNPGQTTIPEILTQISHSPFSPSLLNSKTWRTR